MEDVCKTLAVVFFLNERGAVVCARIYGGSFLSRSMRKTLAVDFLNVRGVGGVCAATGTP